MGFFFFWSSISMRRGAAGNCWFLLRRPQEQAVCHNTRCRASHPAQTGTCRIFISEYICNVDIKIQISAIILTCHRYKISPNDCRIRSATLQCSQQGSGCDLHPPPAALWSSSLSPPPPPAVGKRTTLLWRLVVMETSTVAVTTGFLWHIWWPSQ